MANCSYIEEDIDHSNMVPNCIAPTLRREIFVVICSYIEKVINHSAMGQDYKSGRDRLPDWRVSC